MPELPEVETVRRGLEKDAVGRTIQDIKVNRRDLRFPLPDSFEKTIKDKRIDSFLRRGKYVLVVFDSEDVMVLHLGMSGRIRIFGPEEPYMARKHDHVVMGLDNGCTIVFEDPRRFGYILLTRKENWDMQLPFVAMGPEPLGNGFSGEYLKQKFEGRRVPAKTALLDQRMVAGLGNIYVCEALYRAGIHPARLISDISMEECEALARHIKDVLQDAIKAGGSTLRDYQKTDGSLGYFQYSFGVYDREGHPCPDCDCAYEDTGGVKRITQSGRSSFYCETRQK